MTENIKLPPLPYSQMAGNDFTSKEMIIYATEAIKADRQQRGESVAMTLGQKAVAAELLACFKAWEPMVCVLGNVRARDGADLMQAILNAAPQPAAPAQEPSDELKGLADRAYCQYIDQMSRPECKGVEYKLRKGTFGLSELKAHNKAHEYLGRHRAFSEAYTLLARYGNHHVEQPSAAAPNFGEKA